MSRPDALIAHRVRMPLKAIARRRHLHPARNSARMRIAAATLLIAQPCKFSPTGLRGCCSGGLCGCWSVVDTQIPKLGVRLLKNLLN
jgi:hypothetical protein